MFYLFRLVILITAFSIAVSGSIVKASCEEVCGENHSLSSKCPLQDRQEVITPLPGLSESMRVKAADDLISIAQAMIDFERDNLEYVQASLANIRKEPDLFFKKHGARPLEQAFLILKENINRKIEFLIPLLEDFKKGTISAEDTFYFLLDTRMKYLSSRTDLVRKNKKEEALGIYNSCLIIPTHPKHEESLHSDNRSPIWIKEFNLFSFRSSIDRYQFLGRMLVALYPYIDVYTLGDETAKLLRASSTLHPVLLGKTDLLGDPDQGGGYGFFEKLSAERRVTEYSIDVKCYLALYRPNQIKNTEVRLPPVNWMNPEKAEELRKASFLPKSKPLKNTKKNKSKNRKVKGQKKTKSNQVKTKKVLKEKGEMDIQKSDAKAIEEVEETGGDSNSLLEVVEEHRVEYLQTLEDETVEIYNSDCEMEELKVEIRDDGLTGLNMPCTLQPLQIEQVETFKVVKSSEVTFWKKLLNNKHQETLTCILNNEPGVKYKSFEALFLHLPNCSIKNDGGGSHRGLFYKGQRIGSTYEPHSRDSKYGKNSVKYLEAALMKFKELHSAH